MGRKGQFGVEGEGQEMKASEWMIPDPKSIEVDDPVKTAVMLVVENRIRHLPVVSGESLVGIISDRDLKQAMPSIVAGATSEEYQTFMEETSVEQVMTADPISCAPDDDLVDVVRKFCEKKVGAIPVVEGERLVGIVTQTDMMQAFLIMLEKQ
jgi:acetoin utilization protein AcuB